MIRGWSRWQCAHPCGSCYLVQLRVGGADAQEALPISELCLHRRETHTASNTAPRGLQSQQAASARLVNTARQVPGLQRKAYWCNAIVARAAVRACLAGRKWKSWRLQRSSATWD